MLTQPFWMWNIFCGVFKNDVMFSITTKAKIIIMNNLRCNSRNPPAKLSPVSQLTEFSMPKNVPSWRLLLIRKHLRNIKGEWLWMHKTRHSKRARTKCHWQLTPIVRRVPHAVSLENDACHRGFEIIEHELGRNGREQTKNAHVTI